LKQFITIKRESQDYKSMSESSKNGVDDMITLSELNEGSLLRNLRIRFEKDVIYVLFLLFFFNFFLSQLEFTRSKIFVPYFLEKK